MKSELHGWILAQRFLCCRWFRGMNCGIFVLPWYGLNTGRSSLSNACWVGSGRSNEEEGTIFGIVELWIFLSPEGILLYFFFLFRPDHFAQSLEHLQQFRLLVITALFGLEPCVQRNLLFLFLLLGFIIFLSFLLFHTHTTLAVFVRKFSYSWIRQFISAFSKMAVCVFTGWGKGLASRNIPNSLSKISASRKIWRLMLIWVGHSYGKRSKDFLVTG